MDIKFKTPCQPLNHALPTRAQLKTLKPHLRYTIGSNWGQEWYVPTNRPFCFQWHTLIRISELRAKYVLIGWAKLNENCIFGVLSESSSMHVLGPPCPCFYTLYHLTMYIRKLQAQSAGVTQVVLLLLQHSEGAPLFLEG
jgi:hypothetical protein